MLAADPLTALLNFCTICTSKSFRMLNCLLGNKCICLNYVFYGLLQLLQLCKHGYLQANFRCIVDKRFTNLNCPYISVHIGYIWLHDLETSSLKINNTSFLVLFYKKVLERQCNETNEGGTTSIIS